MKTASAMISCFILGACLHVWGSFLLEQNGYYLSYNVRTHVFRTGCGVPSGLIGITWRERMGPRRWTKPPEYWPSAVRYGVKKRPVRVKLGWWQ